MQIEMQIYLWLVLFGLAALYTSRSSLLVTKFKLPKKLLFVLGIIVSSTGLGLFILNLNHLI